MKMKRRNPGYRGMNCKTLGFLIEAELEQQRKDEGRIMEAESDRLPATEDESASNR